MLRKNEGLTLIELLIALAVGAFVMAGLYRTSIGQQKSYTVQDQVVDVQQNVRAAVDRMTREIRMAGYHKDLLAAAGNISGFTSIITPGNNVNHVGKSDDQITVIIADKAITYSLQWDTANPQKPVLVSSENGGNPEVLADNVENLQIKYTLGDGTVTDLPVLAESIRMVTINVSARTNIKDPQLSRDGYLRRGLSSYTIVRNMGL
jgi:type IV pilus assembly protein PilW